MPIYKKRKYSSYRYGKSSLKSRTYGQYKSAKKGNDTLSFVVNSNQVFSAMYDPDTNTGTACVNVWEVLANNSNFAALASMYDQVRLDGVRVRLSVTDAKTTVNQINEIKNITIYTAWDKTGLSNDQYNIQYIDDKANSYNIKIGRNIVNASDQKKSQLNSFQRWSSFLSNYPSLLAEKSQYIATADIEKTVKSINSDSGLHYFTEKYRYAGVNTVESNNPCLVFESSSIKYKPCLIVGVFSNSVDGNGNITQYGRTQPVIFNGEFSMSLTFKNLKAASVYADESDDEIQPEPTPIDPDTEKALTIYREMPITVPLNNNSLLVDTASESLNNFNIYYYYENTPENVASLQLNSCKVLREFTYTNIITGNGLFTFNVPEKIPGIFALQLLKCYVDVQPRLQELTETIRVNGQYPLSAFITELDETDGISKDSVINVDVSGDVPVLESKSITINSNGSQNVLPSSGYDGLSSVSLTVNVPQPTLEELRVVSTAFNANGEYYINPHSGYDAMEQAKFTVNVPNGTETKSITSNGTYTPTSPNIGFSSVTVNVPNSTEYLLVTTNGNYLPSSGNIGFSSVSVNVPTHEAVLEDTSIGITTNTLTEVTPSSGYDGISKLYINTEIPQKITGARIKYESSVKLVNLSNCIWFADNVTNNENNPILLIGMTVRYPGKIHLVTKKLNQGESTDEPLLLLYKVDNPSDNYTGQVWLVDDANNELHHNNYSWNNDLDFTLNESDYFNASGKLFGYTSNLKSIIFNYYSGIEYQNSIINFQGLIAGEIVEANSTMYFVDKMVSADKYVIYYKSGNRKIMFKRIQYNQSHTFSMDEYVLLSYLVPSSITSAFIFTNFELVDVYGRSLYSTWNNDVSWEYQIPSEIIVSL